ncbi:MAG: hypothetical protein EBS81_12265, partial [Gammaproteobacteria bacterium]|nr:hypothetical protein [Gammaproteobacteria bacterium]
MISGGDDCNDFHNSVVIDNPSFDEITQLGSKFTIMDNILAREGSEEYCNTCFFENQRLETLFEDFDVDNLSSSWLKSSVE